MPLPIILEIITASGKKETIKLPVEIWERNNVWIFKYSSTEEIASVTFDPEHVLPDVNTANDTWKSAK